MDYESLVDGDELTDEGLDYAIELSNEGKPVPADAPPNVRRLLNEAIDAAAGALLGTLAP